MGLGALYSDVQSDPQESKLHAMQTISHLVNLSFCSCNINGMSKVARATGGFTGAELMKVMNTAALVAVRRGATLITLDDCFQVSSRNPALHANALAHGRNLRASVLDMDCFQPPLKFLALVKH